MEMTSYFIIIICLQVLCLGLFSYICIKYVRLKSQKENEYYTDYVHNNLILRIYKPEFEYQAIGNIERDRLLDTGTFSQYYVWTLIQQDGK